MLELFAGAIVAAAVVALVLEPLIRPRAVSTNPPETDFVELEESQSPKIKALLALREIEFDRATGKLSDDDYSELKAKYGRVVLEAIDETGGEGSPLIGDDGEQADIAEIAVARARSRGTTQCVVCGTRPEKGAIFCSKCGRSLLSNEAAPRCWMCGSDLPADAQFCASCGFSLSA